MKETCENCPDFATCTKICEKKIEVINKGTNQSSKEEPESQLNDEQRDGEKDSDDYRGMDRFRRIDLGKLFENAIEPEINWEQTPVQPKAAEIGASERLYLTEQIKWATRNDGPKFKRRFYSFLRCENMTSIAKRAGTSKQNIQKIFERRIDRVYRMLKKSKFADKKIITPLQFKHKVSIADF